MVIHNLSRLDFAHFKGTSKNAILAVFSPHISPGDAVIAPDFLRQWVPATESIAVALVEGARAHWRKKDKQGRIKHSV